MNKAQFNNKINDLWTKTKAGQLPRKQRFIEIERLIDDYIMWNGKRPDIQALDRLSDLALYDDLTDKTPYKIANTEYPFMNARMSDERKARDVKVSTIEVETERKLTGARRKRSPYEHALMDREAKIRNTERRKKYREFTKVQPVKRWNLQTGEIMG